MEVSSALLWVLERTEYLSPKCLSFLPYPPDQPAPLVPPVTLLQILGSLLGWLIRSYLSSSLRHHRLILCTLLSKCLLPWYLNPTSLLTPTSSLEPPRAVAAWAPRGSSCPAQGLWQHWRQASFSSAGDSPVRAWKVAGDTLCPVLTQPSENSSAKLTSLC